ncbi:MAG: hypothetical protein WCI36_04270 [bacterium]
MERNLIIEGIKIDWYKNWGWIRGICNEHVKDRKEQISKVMDSFIKIYAEDDYFIRLNMSPVDRVINDLATMLEYDLKARYFEDRDLRMEYQRFFFEKQDTYNIFFGGKFGYMPAYSNHVAEKIVKEFCKKEKGGD